MGASCVHEAREAMEGTMIPPLFRLNS